MLLISEKVNYEGHFSFLYKNLELNCMCFKLHLRSECINGLTIQAWNTFHNGSWSLTIGMRNLICSNTKWIHQCTSIDSYKCLCMIFIIQLVFISLGNESKLNFWTQLSLLQCIYINEPSSDKPLLRSLLPSQQEISLHSWEIMQYVSGCVS